MRIKLYHCLAYNCTWPVFVEVPLMLSVWFLACFTVGQQSQLDILKIQHTGRTRGLIVHLVSQFGTSIFKG